MCSERAAPQQHRTYAQQMRALNAIASATAAYGKPQVDAALRLGLDQLDLDWAFLAVIDHAAPAFVIENSVGRDGKLLLAPRARLPLEGPLLGPVATTKDVRAVQNAADLAEPPALGGWASAIAVPLFIGGVNYGAIGFTSGQIRPAPFSETNIEFVAMAGELIASAIERSQQREQLQTSETRYRALAEAIPELVWVVDASDRFEYVNPRWTAYTGLTLDASRASGPRAVYATTPGDGEVRLRRFDGVKRWHRMRSVPYSDAAGDVGKWLFTATDIEEHKSAEEQRAGVHDAALAATEAKSRFLATMSHEIRTPMNAVIGMTELLLLTELNAEQRQYIEIVRDSGKSLLRVLNDILDYSKIEAGKLALESVQFGLAGQIESVVGLLRAEYRAKGVGLTTHIAPEVPAQVAGDPGRLRQVLLNLSGNALKFTPAGGSVKIAVSAAAPHGDVVSLRFSIADTGIGISPEAQERLFQPFSQGDESTTRNYGGTGLGLSICAELVALMNGTIGVSSASGAGSTFWFDIPFTVEPRAAKTREVRKRPAPRPRPVAIRAERILLVEDNEINTFLARKQLQHIGFVVSTVSDGQQALDVLQSEHFDLVLMDCHMPRMDGFSATREIRRLEAGGARHLVIVAMTADARAEDFQACLQAGMDDYVSKPTSLDSLRTVLNRWLPTPDRRQISRNGLVSLAAGTSASHELLETFDGDRAAAMTLLGAAAGSIRADFSRIEQSAAERNFAGVADAASRLKGTSESIRSPRLGEISAAVERVARAASENISPALLGELRVAVDALIAEVEASAAPVKIG